MSEEKVLPAGVRFFLPNATAPDFVKANVVISLNEFFKFCKEHPELMTDYNDQKQLKLQIMLSKDGKLYSVVDTFKPTPKAETAQSGSWGAQQVETPQQQAADTPVNNDLPF